MAELFSNFGEITWQMVVMWLIGALLMSVLNQGLMSMNLQGHFQTFFTGLVVILAVLLDNYRNRKANAVKKS